MRVTGLEHESLGLQTQRSTCYQPAGYNQSCIAVSHLITSHHHCCTWCTAGQHMRLIIVHGFCVCVRHQALPSQKGEDSVQDERGQPRGQGGYWVSPTVYMQTRGSRAAKQGTSNGKHSRSHRHAQSSHKAALLLDL